MKEALLIERECLQAVLDAALASGRLSEGIALHVQAAQDVLAQPTGLRPMPDMCERREYFEAACKASTHYKFPLGTMLINGQFTHYHDSDTDSAFAGYRAGFLHGRRWERGITVIPVPAPAILPVPTEVQQA